MAKRSLKFWLGVTLLVTNQPLGWGGMAICAALAYKTGEKKLYMTAGGIIYALSWVMLLLGGFLAGPEGILLVKQIFAKIKDLGRKDQIKKN